MAEADDDLLALDTGADVRLGVAGAAVARDDFHRHLVRATVLGSAQRADRTGDRRVHVRAGAGNHAGGERRGVELVLGVEDQRLVQRMRMQFARLPAVQQMQEVRSDRVVVGVSVSMRLPLWLK